MLKIIFKDRVIIYENARYIDPCEQFVHIYDAPEPAKRKWIASVCYEPGMIIETERANNPKEEAVILPLPQEPIVRPITTGPK